MSEWHQALGEPGPPPSSALRGRYLACCGQGLR